MNMRAKGASPSTAKPTLKLAAEIPSRKPTLIPKKIDQESVNYLREMLRQAETGELIGLAIAAMYKQGNYGQFYGGSVPQPYLCTRHGSSA